MNKEQYEGITAKLQEVQREIEALPESSNNGLLIDAVSHTQNVVKHLREYFQKKGAQQ